LWDNAWAEFVPFLAFDTEIRRVVCSTNAIESVNARIRRYVVGWLIAGAESAALAEKLLADTIAKHHIDSDTLTIHADNGSSMASKPVAFLLADLGVTKTHSRPHVGNDNP
jgi:transposase InsO family protein